MLTKEENELLTHVGPGTPGGELLRRYWHPVAAAGELTEERPKKRVRVLSEDLVLFRAPDGSYGLVGEQCSHRGASLYYGFLEDGCIRCPYHGWLYDAEGRCVETPFEPQQSMLKYGIKHPAYPVQDLGGLLFTFMGPRDRQPLLPRWDMLVRQDGKRQIEIRPLLHCSWLQAEENSADSTHVYFLHTYYDEKARGLRPGIDFDQRPMEQYGFQRFEWGLMKSLFIGGSHPQRLFDRPVIFPNMLRIRNEMHWRVPINDTETRIFHMRFTPTPDGSTVLDSEQPPMRYAPTWMNEDGEYKMDTAGSQDGMAWETQGPIWDRSREHLGSSDHGVAMFRAMLFEQIKVVAEGGDPMALVTDPGRNEMIDMWATYLGVEGDAPPTARREGSSFSGGMHFEQVFDDTHEIFEVPLGAARPQ